MPSKVSDYFNDYNHRLADNGETFDRNPSVSVAYVIFRLLRVGIDQVQYDNKLAEAYDKV